jgi:hypothetical protein
MWKPGEFLPAPLLQLDVPAPNPEWVWVVTPPNSSLPFAIIVGAPAHGFLILLRVISVSPLPPQAPRNWFKPALMTVLDNSRRRGCLGMITLLSDKSEQEQKLARLVLKMGGDLFPFSGSLAVLKLEE